MADPRFYSRSGPFTLGELALVTKSELGPRARADVVITDVAPLDAVEPGLLTYAQAAKNAQVLAGQRRDCAAIVRPEHATLDLPSNLLFNRDPHLAFALAAAHFYPAERQPAFGPSSAIDPSAKIEAGVRVSPGAVIGPLAEIGSGTTIGPNCVIGPAVRIGRNSRIGAGVSLQFAILGNGVIIHPGAAIGQDGFGYIGSAAGHFKIPQLGRVIIQDNVEVGANTTIDRGALGDTLIGEGTKIDNLVQIAHNCRIGRHVVLAAQVGFAGSVTIGDFTVMAGQVGVADHVKIGPGARIAARSGVISDVPAGATFAGFPARPRLEWLREVAWLIKNVKHNRLDKSQPTPPKGEEP